MAVLMYMYLYIQYKCFIGVTFTHKVVSCGMFVTLNDSILRYPLRVWTPALRGLYTSSHFSKKVQPIADLPFFEKYSFAETPLASLP